MDFRTIGFPVTDEWALSASLILIMMCVSPNIVRRAMAPLSGSYFSPVALSFGWFTFVVHMFALTFSRNMFMPKPDFAVTLISGIAGHARSNLSWILGRFVCGSKLWMDDEVKAMEKSILDEAEEGDKPLCVSFCHGVPSPYVGVPAMGRLRLSGALIGIVQLGIASIPCFRVNNNNNNNATLLLFITSTGIFLAYLTAALPRWSTEKWDCPRGKNTTILVPKDSGSDFLHATVVSSTSDSKFFNFETLANLGPKMTRWTQSYSAVMLLLWTAYVGTAMIYVPARDLAYFALAICVGSWYNLLVAELPLSPEELGIPVEYEKCIGNRDDMETLKQVELEAQGIGASLLQTRFPHGIPENDKEWWFKHAPESEYVKRLALQVNQKVDVDEEVVVSEEKTEFQNFTFNLIQPGATTTATTATERGVEPNADL